MLGMGCLVYLALLAHAFALVVVDIRVLLCRNIVFVVFSFFRRRVVAVAVSGAARPAVVLALVVGDM